MDYRVCGKRVCRRAFAFVHGLTIHQLKKIADTLKGGIAEGEVTLPPSNVTHQMGHRKFTDNDLPNYNYATAENVFKENLNTTHVGKNGMHV